MAKSPAFPLLRRARRAIDRAGITLSALCAVHCVLVIVLAGAFGGFLLAPLIHEAGLALALAVGVGAFALGDLRRRAPGVLIAGGCGLALMAIALAAPHGPWEAALTIAGVGLLSLAHWRNLRHAH